MKFTIIGAAIGWFLLTVVAVTLSVVLHAGPVYSFLLGFLLGPSGMFLGGALGARIDEY